MSFDSCYNCGQQGHFAANCPLAGDAQAPSPPHSSMQPYQWQAPPRRYDQDRINAEGAAKCRAAIAEGRNARPGGQP